MPRMITALSILAHGGKPHNVHDLWRTWGLEPGVLIPMALFTWLYARGVRKTWAASGTGHGIRKWEAACYAAGIFALFVALVSPLHPWGRVLFWAHMTQHEILMLVAAPLLVLGRPLGPFLRALPIKTSKRLAELGHNTAWLAVWRFLSNPLTAWFIHAAVLWAWHLPVLFQATLDNETIHATQHLSFILSALLFWWAIIHGRQHAMGYGLAVLYMFTTALHSGLLGVLITFATRIWYPGYQHTTASWGLTPLEDQQLGGLIMWIPACSVYIVAGCALFAGWLREAERRVARAEANLAPGV